MAQAAVGYAQARAIKIKLTGDTALDLARVAAIRAARPDVWLGVDGNQGFTIDQMDALVAGLVAAEGIAAGTAAGARPRGATGRL
jgi:L-alanine-DL-glutamate epimerase-like enolase superfamily enzyme